MKAVDQLEQGGFRMSCKWQDEMGNVSTRGIQQYGFALSSFRAMVHVTCIAVEVDLMTFPCSLLAVLAL